MIFVVSLPRAGSTLAEQILGAHPDVEGAGELGDLAIVVQEESQRRGEVFATWASKATSDDWERLGRRYLERTSRWRVASRVHVDKAVTNWPLVARFSRCCRVRASSMHGAIRSKPAGRVSSSASCADNRRFRTRSTTSARTGSTTTGSCSSGTRAIGPRLRSRPRGSRRGARTRDPQAPRFLWPAVRGELPASAPERSRRAHVERGAGASAAAYRYRARGGLWAAARSVAAFARSLKPPIALFCRHSRESGNPFFQARADATEMDSRFRGNDGIRSPSRLRSPRLYKRDATGNSCRVDGAAGAVCAGVCPADPPDPCDPG